MSKVMDFLLCIISLGIVGLEVYSLVNYLSRPRDYKCLNGMIISRNLQTRNDNCKDALHCVDNVELYQSYIKYTNQGDLLFTIILCFYMLVSIIITAVELILVFYKNKEVHIFLKCLDYIAFVVLSIFQAPLSADYGKCISMNSGREYIEFVYSTYGTIYNIFLLVLLLGSFSSVIAGLALAYFIYLNFVSLKYQYVSNYSSIATAVLISLKHFLTFIIVGKGMINFCLKKRKETEKPVPAI
jgi:hypothetical protein